MKTSKRFLPVLIGLVLVISCIFLIAGCEESSPTYYRCYYYSSPDAVYKSWSTYEASSYSEAMDKCEKQHSYPAECMGCEKTWKDEDGDWVTE